MASSLQSLSNFAKKDVERRRDNHNDDDDIKNLAPSFATAANTGSSTTTRMTAGIVKQKEAPGGSSSATAPSVDLSSRDDGARCNDGASASLTYHDAAADDEDDGSTNNAAAAGLFGILDKMALLNQDLERADQEYEEAEAHNRHLERQLEEIERAQAETLCQIAETEAKTEQQRSEVQLLVIETKQQQKELAQMTKRHNIARRKYDLQQQHMSDASQIFCEESAKFRRTIKRLRLNAVTTAAAAKGYSSCTSRRRRTNTSEADFASTYLNVLKSAIPTRVGSGITTEWSDLEAILGTITAPPIVTEQGTNEESSADRDGNDNGSGDEIQDDEEKENAGDGFQVSAELKRQWHEEVLARFPQNTTATNTTSSFVDEEDDDDQELRQLQWEYAQMHYKLQAMTKEDEAQKADYDATMKLHEDRMRRKEQLQAQLDRLRTECASIQDQVSQVQDDTDEIEAMLEGFRRREEEQKQQRKAQQQPGPNILSQGTLVQGGHNHEGHNDGGVRHTNMTGAGRNKRNGRSVRNPYAGATSSSRSSFQGRPMDITNSTTNDGTRIWSASGGARVNPYHRKAAARPSGQEQQQQHMPLHLPPSTEQHPHLVPRRRRNTLVSDRQFQQNLDALPEIGGTQELLTDDSGRISYVRQQQTAAHVSNGTMRTGRSFGTNRALKAGVTARFDAGDDDDDDDDDDDLSEFQVAFGGNTQRPLGIGRRTSGAASPHRR